MGPLIPMFRTSLVTSPLGFKARQPYLHLTEVYVLIIAIKITLLNLFTKFKQYMYENANFVFSEKTRFNCFGRLEASCNYYCFSLMSRIHLLIPLKNQTELHEDDILFDFPEPCHALKTTLNK